MNMHEILHSIGSCLSCSALLERLFLASIEFAVLSLLVAALIRAARVRAPRIQLFLWLLVIIKPLVSLAIGSPLAIKLEVTSRQNVETTARAGAPVPAALPGAVTATSPTGVPRVTTEGAPRMVPADVTLQNVTKPTEKIAVDASPAPLLPRVLVPLWLAGTSFFLGRHLLCRMRLRRVLRATTPVADALKVRYESLAQELGMKRVPTLSVVLTAV